MRFSFSKKSNQTIKITKRSTLNSPTSPPHNINPNVNPPGQKSTTTLTSESQNNYPPFSAHPSQNFSLTRSHSRTSTVNPGKLGFRFGSVDDLDEMESYVLNQEKCNIEDSSEVDFVDEIYENSKNKNVNYEPVEIDFPTPADETTKNLQESKSKESRQDPENPKHLDRSLPKASTESMPYPFTNSTTSNSLHIFDHINQQLHNSIIESNRLVEYYNGKTSPFDASLIHFNSWFWV